MEWQESLWARAYRETRAALHSGVFLLGDLVISAGVGAGLAVETGDLWLRVGIAMLGGAATFVLLIGLWFVINLPIAFVKQRHEARQELFQQLQSTVDLAVTWSSQGISIPLHGQGGTKSENFAFSTEPPQLIYHGQGTIDIRKVIVFARIRYGQVGSPSAIRQMSVEERGGASSLEAAMSGEPMELRWSPEDGGHVRQLEGLPVTIRAGDPLQLPHLWLRVGDKDRAIELFEQCGNRATWLWSLTINTDKGRYTFDIATPILMQSPPEEE